MQTKTLTFPKQQQAEMAQQSNQEMCMKNPETDRLIVDFPWSLSSEKLAITKTTAFILHFYLVLCALCSPVKMPWGLLSGLVTSSLTGWPLLILQVVCKDLPLTEF